MTEEPKTQAGCALLGLDVERLTQAMGRHADADPDPTGHWNHCASIDCAEAIAAAYASEPAGKGERLAASLRPHSTPKSEPPGWNDAEELVRRRSDLSDVTELLDGFEDAYHPNAVPERAPRIPLLSDGKVGPPGVGRTAQDTPLERAAQPPPTLDVERLERAIHLVIYDAQRSGLVEAREDARNIAAEYNRLSDGR